MKKEVCIHAVGEMYELAIAGYGIIWFAAAVALSLQFEAHMSPEELRLYSLPPMRNALSIACLIVSFFWPIGALGELLRLFARLLAMA